MPRGKKANAEVSLDALEAQLKTQYDLNVVVINELKGKNTENDDEDVKVKEAIKLLRTPGLDFAGDILPYLKMRVSIIKNKGRVGTKKPKPASAPTLENAAPTTEGKQ